jgi:catechol-2,3-dioxygenase
MDKLDRPVQGLAEISLRVHDLAAMRRFYEEVICLEVLREYEHSEGKAVFYAVGAGAENMALFEGTIMSGSMRDKSPQIDPKPITLDHIAFNISLKALESEKRRPAKLGVEIIRADTSSWMHTRMFYFTDPEGNMIESESYDESIR